MAYKICRYLTRKEFQCICSSNASNCLYIGIPYYWILVISTSSTPVQIVNTFWNFWCYHVTGIYTIQLYYTSLYCRMWIYQYTYVSNHLTAARKVNLNTHISGGKDLHEDIHSYVSIRYWNWDFLTCQRTDSRTVICNGPVAQITISCGGKDLLKLSARKLFSCNALTHAYSKPRKSYDVLRKTLTVTDSDIHRHPCTEAETQESTANIHPYPSALVRRHRANVHVDVWNTHGHTVSHTLLLLYLHQLPKVLRVHGRQVIRRSPSVISHGLLGVNGASRGRAHEPQHEKGWQRESSWIHGAWS